MLLLAYHFFNQTQINHQTGAFFIYFYNNSRLCCEKITPRHRWTKLALEIRRNLRELGGNNWESFGASKTNSFDGGISWWSIVPPLPPFLGKIVNRTFFSTYSFLYSKKVHLHTWIFSGWITQYVFGFLLSYFRLFRLFLLTATYRFLARGHQLLKIFNVLWICSAALKSGM